MRAGDLAAWADTPASPALVSFLVQSARNLARSDRSGWQMAEHLAELLERSDPEPGVGFATVGPGGPGWMALLHGPANAWDGTSWLSPEAERGWLRCTLHPRPSIAVSRPGTAPPSPSPDEMWDLEAGVVPGAGFVLMPADELAGEEPREAQSVWLVADDGSVHRLDRGCLIGADPPGGTGLAPLKLPGPDVAPVHAELRPEDRGVVLADRGSPAGTFVYRPGCDDWERLPESGETVLAPGSHVAVGQRVITLVARQAGQDPETRSR